MLNENQNGKQEWVYCPVCGNKTRLRLREDTVLTHFPLFCPKCKKESLIDAKEYVVKTAGKALADKDDRTPEEDDMLDMMLNGSERVKAENLKHIIDWYDTAERGEK